MAPYILFGLIFAGFLHEVVPDSIVKNHLGNDSILSVIKSTVFGIPLPVCSCGVIPLAASIKKSGASNGSTLSFLISTPITGVDSILATYGMFGWAFTIYRVITSMIISIIAGILTNIYAKEKEELQVKPTFSMSAPTQQPNSIVAFSSAANPLPKEQTVQEGSSCSIDGVECNESKKYFFKRVFSYAFGTLLKDIASPLLMGLLIGALITVAIPENLSEILLEYNWISYIIVIAIAVPMYVCATASLPIAAGLMLAGVSPGAAFVFLSAGPATNTVTIGVVQKMLGTRTLYIYLGTIIVGSVLFGFGLDYILRDVSIDELVHMHEDFGIVAWTSTVILWSFVLYYMIKPYFIKENKSCCSS